MEDEFPNGSGHAYQLSKRIDTLETSIRDLDTRVDKRLASIERTLDRLSTELIAEIKEDVIKIQTSDELALQAKEDHQREKEDKRRAREIVIGSMSVLALSCSVLIPILTH